MARGFAAGLFQGVLACSAGLVVLSLLLPLPPRPVIALTPEPSPAAIPDPAVQPQAEPVPVPAAVEIPPAPATPLVAEPVAPPAPLAPVAEDALAIPPPAPATASEAEDADSGPAAETLAMPEASEFARSSDLAPATPEPMATLDRPGEAPAIPAPAGEISPASATPVPLPEARGDAPAAPTMTAPAPDPVDLPLMVEADPAAQPTPAAATVPERPMLPEGAPDAAPVARIPAPAPVSAPAVGDGLDLTTPPDFGALHLNDAN